MIDKDTISGFRSILDKPCSSLIITHLFPDSDALCSSLALASFIKKFNDSSVTVIVPNAIPSSLKWMPGVGDVLVAEEEAPSKIVDLFEKASVVYCLDFSQKQRIGPQLTSLLDVSLAKKIIVDHHAFPQDFGDIYFHDIAISSTCEIIFEMIASLGETSKISPEIANCLYAGIAADTGFFKHPCTSARTHYVVGDLIHLGAEISVVSNNISDSNSISKINFLSHLVSNELRVVDSLCTAYAVIREKDLNHYGLSYEDTEYVLSQIVSIKGINFVILFKEIKGKIKVSMRSKGEIPVNQIAIKYFNGGGHKNAAGGLFDGAAEDALKLAELIITENFDLLRHALSHLQK